jgi:hypothetical protein
MDIIEKRALTIIKNDLVIPSGICTVILQDAKTGQIKSVDHVKNLVTTVGKGGIAGGLTGVSSIGYISWCAVGTGTTAPAAADIKLQTESYRKLISVRSVAANVMTAQTFFNISEANGTLKEAGLFGDDTATDTVNSGTLYCHLAINRVKSASDTLTLSWALTVG